MLDINQIESFDPTSFKKHMDFPSCPLEGHFEQMIQILKEEGGNHLTHLAFLKDKEVFWTKDQSVFIVYRQIANKLIVLGDPIGNKENIKDSIKEFCEYSQNKGLKPVFYQISSRYMSHYHESGYRFIKLGEEGLVDLERFTLSGKHNSNLRNRMNNFEKNGFTFEVVHPPFDHELLRKITHVSNSWLGNQKEKEFSVASFREDYVSRFPIAVLWDAEGKLIAFSTLAPNYKGSISIDLMRRVSDSPPGTMAVLFIHIFNWAKTQGYQSCSLGMSPLSNVGNSSHSLTSEKIIRLAYLYGNSLYNFRGLKEFKDKFSTSWEPKYLAYKKTTLPIAFVQLFLLINGKPRVKFLPERR
ncbi:phosphatidylglycerol lysyltransferase domain-containing protein [Bacillus sp. SCS-153A]|uniref:phosphatidylglycerol lysyltransferase domain-containing protein n=1 Tax=Rossellomorea sedimentorum TaxID=3115294 RepID=UPI003905D6FF